MPRRSIKENKSVYQIAREECGYTREKASEKMNDMISAEKLEKIENGRLQNITPDDVWIMSRCYKKPELCNYYCTHECAIGQKTMPEVKSKEIAQIAVETLNSLNKLNKAKDRLLEIVEDGKVSEDEIEDFVNIKKTMDRISLSVASLQLWIDNTIAQGELDESLFD